MKKIFALILALCFVVPLVVACSSGATATPAAATTAPAVEATETPWVFDGTNYKGEVKIGVSCSLTGPVPLEGASSRDGAQLAVDQWNEKGGVQGYKVVPVFEDDANDATAAVNVAQKFGADPSILLMIGPLRSASNAGAGLHHQRAWPAEPCRRHIPEVC